MNRSIPRLPLLLCALLLSPLSPAAGDLGARFDANDIVSEVAPREPAAAGTAAVPAAAKARVIDQIVAVVNDEVITQVDLDERTDTLAQQLARQSASAGQNAGQLPERGVLRRQVLERMITDRVLVQYGRESGMRVDDATLDRAVARIADDSKASLADFRKKLLSEGVSWARFREEIRNEILFARLRDREVDSKLTVSDGEVDAELREAASRGANEDELMISHVLIAVPEQADPEQTLRREARARAALERLQAGDSFAQVAATYSDAPDALQGGSLGWRTVSRIPSVFANVAPGMKKGELSAIIRSGSGFHIFQVTDRRGTKTPEVVRQYHLKEILIRVDPNNSESEARARLQALRARIEGGEDFQQIARLNSEDESRAKGGDIGWVSTGETFPAFEKAMLALKPGQTSDIIQTPLGLHLVQLVETRENDVGEERRRASARQGVRARKVDEAFDDWVRQQRDGAYVEYRNGERQL
jgi:peptidyl-prolyl cis-trans isomerase SurA